MIHEPQAAAMQVISSELTVHYNNVYSNSSVVEDHSKNPEKSLK